MATGFLFGGYCYATVNAAGDALALSLSTVTPGVSVPSASLYVRYTHTLACSRSSSTATTAAVQCSSLVTGSTSTTANGAQTAFTQTQTGMGGFSTGFPSCEVAATESEQVAAVNALLPAVLGALGVIWGLKTVYRLLMSGALSRNTAQSGD